MKPTFSEQRREIVQKMFLVVKEGYHYNQYVLLSAIQSTLVCSKSGFFCSRHEQFLCDTGRGLMGKRKPFGGRRNMGTLVLGHSASSGRPSQRWGGTYLLRGPTAGSSPFFFFLFCYFFSLVPFFLVISLVVLAFLSLLGMRENVEKKALTEIITCF